MNKKRKFLNKLSTLLMLGLIVGSTVAPTVVSASEVATELELNIFSEVTDVIEDDTTSTNTVDDNVSVDNSNNESTDNEVSTEKVANAPNLGEVDETFGTYVADIDFTKQVPASFGEKLSKTRSAESVYTVEVDKVEDTNQLIKILGIASAAHNYDNFTGETLGLETLNRIKEMNFNIDLSNEANYDLLNDLASILSVKDSNNLKYIEDTSVIINSQRYTLPDGYSAELKTSTGISGLYYGDTQVIGKEARAANKITQTWGPADGLRYKVITFDNPAGYQVGPQVSWMLRDNNGTPWFCLNAPKDWPNSITTAKSDADMGEFWNQMSKKQKDVILSYIVAGNEGGYTSYNDIMSLQLAIWAVLHGNNVDTVTEARSKANSWVVDGSDDGSINKASASAQKVYDKHFKGRINNDFVWNGSGFQSAEYQEVISLLDGIPWDPYGGAKVTKTFSNISNQEVAEVCSQVDITVTDNKNEKFTQTMKSVGNSCVAEWPENAFYTGNATITESRNDSPYWVIKNGTVNVNILDGQIINVSGNSGIVNQTSVTDLTVSKTINDNSNQANVLADMYTDIKVSLVTTGSTPVFKNASDYKDKSLNTSGKYTFQNLVPGTYRLTETYPAYLGGITETRDIVINKNGSVTQGTQSTSLVNEVKVSDLVVYKDIKNPSAIDTQSLVNPSDIKVTIVPTGNTPAFDTNLSSYQNQSLAWPTASQQVAYGVDANEPIFVFKNLVAGTYTVTETYPSYLGGMTTSFNITITDADTGLASANKVKVPANHLVNKIIAGNATFEKDWSNAGLNSNISESDVINSSAQVKPSDFKVEITGTNGLATHYGTQTFTFDNNYKITTPVKSMPQGTYSYKEIDNSTGAHKVVDTGTFTITNDGETANLTDNKIMNALDLAAFNVSKTVNMGDIEQFCKGTQYDDVNGDRITVTEKDCLEFIKTNVVADGDVEITIVSSSNNGFNYSETKPLKWSGNTYGTNFSGLPLGTYTMTETYIAGQMQGITTSQTITLTKDGQTVTAGSFKNDVLYGRFEVAKRDADTGGLIGGGIGGNSDKRATFAIWDFDASTNKVVGTTPIDVISTNLDGTAMSRWIPLLNTGQRTVFVQEVEAPDGYFLNGVATPDLKEGGYVYTLTAGNHKETIELTYNDVEIEDGEIKINKVITNTDNKVLEDQALEGFEFTIFNNVKNLPNFGQVADGYESQIGVGSKLPQVLYTDNLGEALSNKLVANYSSNSINNKPVNGDMNYLLSETDVPEGFDWMYIKPQDMSFTMTQDNIVYNFSFVNILKDLVININKVDENGLKVSGVEFTVYNKGVQDSTTGKWAFNNKDIVGTYVTDENGQITMDKMPVNQTYYVVETSTKLGEDGKDMYYYSEEPIVFTPEYIESITDVNKDVVEVTQTVTNTSKKANLTMNKFDDLGQQALSGAEFKLSFNHNGKAKETLHNVKEVLTLKDLFVYNADGSHITYTLTETKAPNGFYVIEPFKFHFEQDSNGNIVVVLEETNKSVEVSQLIDNKDTDSPSLFALFDKETNNVNSNMNIYDKRIVVDVNVLKLTEDAKVLDNALNINESTDIQTPDTGLAQIDENGVIVNDRKVSLDDKIDAHTPNNISRLAGAEFEISTYFDREMLKTYGYEIIDGVLVERTADSVDTATPDNGLAQIDKDGNIVTTISDLYPGYNITNEVVNTFDKGHKIAANNGLTFTTDATNEVVTVKADNLTYLLEYTEGMSFDVIGATDVKTNVIEANSSNVYVINPGEVIVLNQDTNVVKPHIEVKESSDMLRTTGTVDKNGYLNMVLPMYDANNMPIIYQIKETKAPEGYAIIEEPMFVYFTLTENGYAVTNILSETVDFDLSGPTNLVSPNEDFWNFNFNELFKDAFVEQVDKEGNDGYSKYIIDITDSWKAATKDVDADNFTLEVWLSIYNSLITGNLLINKEVNDNNLANLEDTKEYMDTYAINGYDVITKGQYEELQNIAPQDLNNKETNRAYSKELDANDYSYFSSEEKELQFLVNSKMSGIYNVINFDSNLEVNGEAVEFDENNKASVSVKPGDLVTMTEGDIAISTIRNSEEKLFNEEAGNLVSSYNEGQIFTVDANTAGTYFVNFDKSDISYNGYRFTNDEGQLKVTLSSGDVVKVFKGTISLYEVVTTGVDLSLNKEYTGNLTNDELAVIVDNGDITGANTEWRLWNEVTNPEFAFDQTLLASADGRVYFDGFSILDENDKEIVYYLQEVGAPAPIIAEPIITAFTFNIDENGNLIATTEDKVTYTSAGTVDKVTNTVSDAVVGTFEDAAANENGLVYEIYREDAIFKEIEAEKSVEDASANNILEEGEDATYHITITNNGGLNSVTNIQDTLKGLDRWFNIDEEALAQELVFTETALTESNPFTQIEVANLAESLTDGESVTIDQSQAGKYSLNISAGAIVSYNGETKLYENDTVVDMELKGDDVISVKSGTVNLINNEVKEEPTVYTLQDLINGFDYKVNAFTKVDVAFTLTAKDTFESTAYCQVVTNVATITPTYPDKPEIEIDPLEPTVDLPVECLEKGNVDAYKTSFDASGDDIVTKGEKVTYEIGVENLWAIPVNDVFVQDTVVEQLSSFFDMDMNQKLVLKVNGEVIESEYTLQNLNDGITLNMLANSKLSITFEVTAKADLGTVTSDTCQSEIECPDIENTATIKVTEPVICTPDEDGNLPEECETESETDSEVNSEVDSEVDSEIDSEVDSEVESEVDTEVDNVVREETELTVTDTIKVDCEVPLCEEPDVLDKLKKLEYTGQTFGLAVLVIAIIAGITLFVRQRKQS